MAMLPDTTAPVSYPSDKDLGEPFSADTTGTLTVLVQLTRGMSLHRVYCPRTVHQCLDAAHPYNDMGMGCYLYLDSAAGQAVVPTHQWLFVDTVLVLEGELELLLERVVLRQPWLRQFVDLGQLRCVHQGKPNVK